MSSLRALARAMPAFALIVFIAGAAEGQRRRSAPSAPFTPSQGACHTFDYVAAGLQATYHATGPSGDADFTITWLSDTATQTKTTQVVTTAQGRTDVETVLDGEVFGNLRGLRHLNVKTTQTVPVIGKVTAEVDIDFVPSLTSGPAAGWCVGNTWTVPPVTETIVAKTAGGTQPPIIVTTAGSTGEVLAVGEMVTVPGGTFATVRYRGAIVSGTSVQTAITWMSMEHNIVVRQDTLDGGGAVTSTTTLTSVTNLGQLATQGLSRAETY